MYKIGDYVIYRQLNVCKIEGIETPSFEADRNKKYYKLRPAFDNKNDTTIYVPVGSNDGLHPVSDEKDVRRALNELPKIKPSVYVAKKPAQLSAYYQELLSSHNLKNYLSLIKEVALKEKTSAKRLSEIDVRFRNRAERLICEEFAIVLDETPDAIKSKIYDTMKTE